MIEEIGIPPKGARTDTFALKTHLARALAEE